MAEECPRWMYHRPGSYCHACGRVGAKASEGTALSLDLPPGGKAKSDWKKPKEKKK